MDFELSFLITSLVAGFLTVLAPCILPLLPIIISGSSTEKDFSKPLRIITSLGISIIAFTLVLKTTTNFFDIPDKLFVYISGGILIAFGLVTLFPELWERFAAKLNLNSSSNRLLGKGMKQGGTAGDFLIGGALGPVFSSCSPTYALIVVSVIPASYAIGMAYLIAYVVGLAIPLLMLAFFGQRVAGKLATLSDPKSTFKRVIAIIFIVVGIAILTGYDKEFEAWILQTGAYDWIINLEDNLLGR